MLAVIVVSITIGSAYNKRPQTVKMNNDSISQFDTVAPIRYAEEMPYYNGGDKKLNKYLYKHLGLRGKGKGIVIAHISLDEQGVVKDASILKTFDESLNEEVIAAMMKMPKWYPARRNGRPIPYEWQVFIRYE